MAEVATIARPYAEALFEVARSDLEGTTLWLNALARVADDAQLQSLAQHPRVSSAQLCDLMLSVAGVDDARAASFLRTVVDNARLGALPEIAQQFNALVNAGRGVSEAVVYSAFAMDDAALGQLQGLLEKRFATRLHLVVQLDASLIGGVRVVVGDQVLDTSVRARLDQMKAALMA